MNTVVDTLYRESQFGVPIELDGAGTSLENPYVYDSAARDLHSMADEGLVEIVDERVRRSLPLIERITFARLR